MSHVSIIWACMMALLLASAIAQPIRLPSTKVPSTKAPSTKAPSTKTPSATTFTALPLGYPVTAVEPAIDTLTMTLHHGTHYPTFINNLNNLTAGDPALRALGVTGIVLAVPTNKLPAASARALRNNAGGAWNHALYFKTLATPGTARTRPTAISPALNSAIATSFGSLGALRAEMTQAGTRVFGSGWSWVCYTGVATKPLAVTASPNQDNPLMGSLGGLISEPNCIPILGLDVWEHAYYKKHGPKRADYIAAWWTAVNWAQVSSNFELAAAGKLAEIGQ